MTLDHKLIAGFFAVLGIVCIAVLAQKKYRQSNVIGRMFEIIWNALWW